MRHGSFREALAILASASLAVTLIIHRVVVDGTGYIRNVGLEWHRGRG